MIAAVVFEVLVWGTMIALWLGVVQMAGKAFGLWSRNRRARGRGRWFG